MGNHAEKIQETQETHHSISPILHRETTEKTQDTQKGLEKSNAGSTNKPLPNRISHDPKICQEKIAMAAMAANSKGGATKL